MSAPVAAIMRHGEYRQPAETPGALLPYPLTERGREQALEAARRLYDECRERGWTLHSNIQSSSTLRAAQTASIVAAELRRLVDRDFPVTHHDDLVERIVGAAANLTMSQIAAVVAEDPRLDPLPDNWKRMPDYRLPFLGAESPVEAGRRVAERMEREMSRIQTQSDTAMLFVGHGGSFRFSAVALGLLEKSEAPNLTMKHCDRVFIAREAADRWLHVAGEWKKRKQSDEVAAD